MNKRKLNYNNQVILIQKRNHNSLYQINHYIKNNIHIHLDQQLLMLNMLNKNIHNFRLMIMLINQKNKDNHNSNNKQVLHQLCMMKNTSKIRVNK